MSLLDPMFGWSSVDAIFSNRVRLQRMLDFEGALARAEASVGVIPAEAASVISGKCRAELFDFDALSQAAVDAGNLAIPMVKQLTELVGKQDPDAARYVHWGATSQDAIDTGLVLQLRDALSLIGEEVDRLCAGLAHLADRYRETPLAARTWLQQAVPTTFGLKAAGWLDAVMRHRARIGELQQRVLMLQFGGAAGTLASLHDRGLEVAKALAKELKLVVPDVPWHAHRDRIAEVATTLALLTGTLGKIARDISLQMQTEVGELLEPAGEGRGGSSTMPQKRNPVACAAILAAAERVPGLASVILSAMPQEHERGLGGWHAEWETLPELVRLSAGALHRMTETIAGLEVDAERMRQNLEITHGLIYAEAAAMALSPLVGKQAAHQMVENAAQKAISEKKHLRDLLAADPEITSRLKATDLAQLFDPAKYTGMSSEFIARVLRREKNREGDVELGDVRIRCEISGGQYLPVLVLSNSLGTNLTMWDPQMPGLTSYFRIVRYDMRGHGQSQVTPGPYTIPQLAADVLHLLDELSVDKFDFCGLSMSGMIGMELALRAPDRLRKVILCNTAPKLGTAATWNTRIQTVEANGMKAVADTVIERWFTPEFRAASPGPVETTKQMLLDTPPEGYAACCGAIRDMDAAAAIREIRVPTLIIHGSRDPVTAADDGQKMANAIPGAQLVELPVAHMSNIEGAAAFTAAITKFLRT